MSSEHEWKSSATRIEGYSGRYRLYRIRKDFMMPVNDLFI